MAVEHEELSQAMSLAKHDLSTPLSVAMGYLGMLLKGQAGPISESQRKMLEETQRSCARINNLLNEMSAYGKLESGSSALARLPLELGAVLAELASHMHENGDHGVHIETRGTDRPLEVVGDRDSLKAALKTLLHLVVREQTRGSVVVAECSTTGASQPAAIVAIGREAAVQELALAAETGRLVAEWKHGTGFALPIARRIVEAHGGTIWSAPGDESFRPRSGMAIRLPLRTS